MATSTTATSTTAGVPVGALLCKKRHAQTVIAALDERLCKKIKGCIRDVDEVRVMRSGETRALVHARKIGIHVKVRPRVTRAAPEPPRRRETRAVRAPL